MKYLIHFLYVFFIILFFSCGSGENVSVFVSWDVNKELAVNQTGGGYIVYYNKKPNFNINDSDTKFVDVPYTGDLLSSTSITIKMEKNATYYLKVVAYATYDAVKIYSSSSSQIIINS